VPGDRWQVRKEAKPSLKRFIESKDEDQSRAESQLFVRL
jgi:hypothetical protein